MWRVIETYDSPFHIYNFSLDQASCIELPIKNVLTVHVRVLISVSTFANYEKIYCESKRRIIFLSKKKNVRYIQRTMIRILSFLSYHISFLHLSFSPSHSLPLKNESKSETSNRPILNRGSSTSAQPCDLRTVSGNTQPCDKVLFLQRKTRSIRAELISNAGLIGLPGRRVLYFIQHT